MQFRNQAIHLPLCNCLQKFFNKNGLVVKTGFANRVNLMSHSTEQKDKSTQRGKQIVSKNACKEPTNINTFAFMSYK